MAVASSDWAGRRKSHLRCRNEQTSVPNSGAQRPMTSGSSHTSSLSSSSTRSITVSQSYVKHGAYSTARQKFPPTPVLANLASVPAGAREST